MFTGTLHPYQVEDTEKMKARQKMLVAYGQGTGKTVMSISVIEDLFDTMFIVEPGLVICLSSLKYQWADAIARFTCTACEGTLDASECNHKSTSTSIVIDGTAKQRAEQYAEAAEYDYIILSYEQVVNDWDQVKGLPRGFMILDEASFIKGFNSKRSKYIKKLDSDYKFALTGTPIENGKPEELFSIMQWVDPKVFGRFDLFDKTFIVRNDNGWVSRYRNIPTFLKRLETCMVRRTPADPDVAPFMPDQNIKPPLLVTLDPASRKAYKVIAQDLLKTLVDAQNNFGSGFDLNSHYGWGNGSDAADKMRGKIGQRMLALQMLCDHPDLIRISAAKSAAGTGGSAYAEALVLTGVLDKCTKSAKLQALVKYVRDILDADPRNKIVIFTHYVDMVTLIGEALPCDWRPFTGKDSAKQKQANKVAFQTDPDIRVLVSSDAGGYGVDLPQANYLINYDLPDKAGTADQRDTRIVRASSEFETVTITAILVAGSLEERKYQALNQKRAIAAAFLDGQRINSRGGVDLDLATVTNFLSSSSV